MIINKSRFFQKSVALGLSLLISSSMISSGIAAESTTEASKAINGMVYATVNMPYADFYYGELKNISAGTKTTPELTVEDPVSKAGYRQDGHYDAVSSATKVKSKNFITTYFEETDKGVNILGIKDVQIAIPEALYLNAKKAKANNESCNNKLLNFVDSSVVSNTAFSEYKVLNADGTFSKMVSETQIATKAVPKFTYFSNYGNYEFNIEGIEINKDLMLGAVIETKNLQGETNYYGMKHLDNLWISPQEMSFAVKEFKEPHGNFVDYKAHQSIEGQTITKVTYLMKNAPDVVIPANFTAKKLFKENTTLTVDNISLSNNSLSTKLKFTNIPTGYDGTLVSLTSKTETIPTGSYNFDSKTGILTLNSINTWKPGSYTVLLSDDEYQDIKASFLVVSKLNPSDIAIKANTLKINSKDATVAEYLAAITSVKLDGQSIKGKTLGNVLFNKDGSINFEANVTRNEVKTLYFPKGKDSDYTLSLTADGYPSIEAKIGKSYVNEPTENTTTDKDNNVSQNTTTENNTSNSNNPSNTNNTTAAPVKITAPAVPSVTVKSTTSSTLTVNWSKAQTATGYEVQYSTSVNFTKPVTLSISSTTLSKSVTKLTKKTKYYVRVRSFVNSTETTTKAYSAWSTVKFITVK